jgi:hypothetical protein
LCLFQVEEDRPLLFDLRVLTNGLRTSISDAVQRTISQPNVTGDRAQAAGQD